MSKTQMGKDRIKEGGFSNFSSYTNTQVCSNFLRREYFSQGLSKQFSSRGQRLEENPMIFYG